MSIKDAILKAANVTKKRGEDDQDFLKVVVAAITEIDDKKWAALGQDAQGWFNEAVDAINDNKKIAPFPEDVTATPPPRSTRSSKKEEPTAESVIGSEVKVTTARGKIITGTIIEIDEESMVVKDGEGEEHEFDRSRVQNVEFIGAESASPTQEEDREPVVGDEVILTTKRGVVSEGKILEMDDNVVVLDTGNGEDTEFSRSRIGSMVISGATATAPAQEDRDPVVGDIVEVITKRGKEVNGTVVEIDGDTLVIGTSPDGEEIETDMSTAKSIKITTPVVETKSTRASPRAAASPAASPAAAPAAKEGGKATKISAKANGGISAPTRMKEIICADPDITMAEVGKILKAEKLQYNENTLQINFKLVTGVIELLKQNKHYK